MAIGERIRFFRNMKGITQKYLGMVVGFPERSADLTKTLADFFDISPDALTVPDIDTDIGLMHTLFALEDIRGLTIGEIDGEVCLRLDKSKGKTYTNMLDMLSAWAEQAKKLEAGEITREDYDRWRYNYPKYDTTLRWAKVPSQELSDFLVDALKDSPDTDE